MYKLKRPLEDMLLISPQESLEAIRETFDEIAAYGSTYFQWSRSSQPLNHRPTYQAFTELHPMYNDMPRNQQNVLRKNFIAQQPNYFFIEVFGGKYGFVRATGTTFEEIAQRILEKIQKMHHCPEHEWAYTHSNGHKTCKKCSFFADCTVDEALAHYEKGEVKINANETLQFDHTKELCICGSHSKLWLRHSHFPEKNAKCTACHQFIPLTKENSILSLPLTTDEQIKSDFVLENETSMDEKELNHVFSSWLHTLYMHHSFVEKTEQPFIEWVQPYLNKATTLNTLYVQKEDSTFLLHHLNLKTFHLEEEDIHMSYELQVKLTDKDVLSKSDAFRSEMLTFIQEL